MPDLGFTELFTRQDADYGSQGGGECHHLVELGAGDGSFALSLARRLSSVGQLRKVTLVDQAAFANGNAQGEFAKLGCVLNITQADVFDWLAGARAVDVIVANHGDERITHATATLTVPSGWTVSPTASIPPMQLLRTTPIGSIRRPCSRKCTA